MDIGKFLAITAALCHIAAYLDYNRKVFRGETRPNGATWLIWASLAGLNASSYLVMSSDLVKGIFPVINTALCIGTFVLALYLKKFEWPDNWDLLALATGLVAALAWWKYQSATSANLILQLAIFWGFIPTYRLVWRDPLSEKPRPWWIWVGAYVFLTATVVWRWQGQWQDLAYPVNCLILHCFVPGFVILRMRKNKK